MCGIAGIVLPDSSALQDQACSIVSDMTDALFHRGPDGSGIWCSEESTIILGHRRLAVLDLSTAGAQPMLSACGNWTVVFNGEIYNYKEIERDINKEGVVTSGNSDTEVLVEAIALWGVDTAAKRCIGMFAIAAWDNKKKKLYLIRDRMGEKPLYYGYCGSNFVFGSELGALKKHPLWQGNISKESLSMYVRYGYVPAPNSIYSNIYKLEPGNILCLDSESVKNKVDFGSQIYPYWSLAETVRNSNYFVEGPAALVAGLDRELHKVISRQMISDVPLGAFLSGGIDSALVAAIMQSESAIPVNTFTIGFDAKEFNEANHAKSIAAHLGTNHSELYINNSDVLGVIDMLSNIYDEPFADSSQLPMYLLCAMAKKHVTVCLSGDGGDELFCGYNRYLHAKKLWRTIDGLPQALKRALKSALINCKPTFFDGVIKSLSKVLPALASVKSGNSQIKISKIVAALDAHNYEEFYLTLVSYCKEPENLVLGGGVGICEIDKALPTGMGSPVGSLMLRDQLTYLRDDNLVKVDRAAMSVSLETRLPLLDHNIIDYSWNVPFQYHVREDKSKWLLRQVLYKYVPESLMDRPKMGFSVPMAEWLRGELKDWAESMLDKYSLVQDGYFNAQLVQRYWNEHQSKEMDHSMVLWSILAFQVWLKGG